MATSSKRFWYFDLESFKLAQTQDAEEMWASLLVSRLGLNDKELMQQNKE